MYYPSEKSSKAPIFFWYYGGGFTRGARNLIPDILFDNIGAFFAQRGVLTVIADYRLVPDVFYPEPVKDLRDALKFVLSSPEVDIQGSGDKNNIFFGGHSAGACHLMTLLFNESILGDFDRSCIKGAILVSGVYGKVRSEARPYYGPEDEYMSKTPLGLLKSHSFGKVRDPHNIRGLGYN
jgi:acetyl esterase/lipase